MLDGLLSSARSERPDHVALVLDEASLTFEEAIRAADRLAAAVELSPGERVAVVAPNVPALVIGMFAAWRAGAVAVPLSARLRSFELGRAFADARPSVAVSVTAHAGFALAEKLGALADRTPTMRARALVDDFGEILDTTRFKPPEAAERSEGELAAILYTSGTTGEPKGALLPHRLADAMAASLAEVLGGQADATFALVPPASHMFGLGCLLSGIAAGATAVLVEAAVSVDPLVQAMRRHDAVILHGTPPLFGRLLRSGAKVSLQGGFVAGSWCPPEVLEGLDEHGARVLNLYGMTEIGAATTCRADDPPAVRYQTVGRPLPGYEVRVQGGAPEAPGEVQVRSGYLPSGYHGGDWGPEELAEGGWFRTGDLGELDPHGNVTIAGRAKEVIHVGGFNVFPAEIEAYLLTNPSIAGAAVIGVPHPVLGEAAQAFVVPAKRTTLEPREVITFARAGIAGYKVPYRVRVVDELPLLPSGKTDRRALAALAPSPDSFSAAPEEAVR